MRLIRTYFAGRAIAKGRYPQYKIRQKAIKMTRKKKRRES